MILKVICFQQNNINNPTGSKFLAMMTIHIIYDDCEIVILKNNGTGERDFKMMSVVWKQLCITLQELPPHACKW